MKEPVKTKRDIARELARKYSTMTHDELDILEGILRPKKYSKGSVILKEGEVCRDICYIDKGLIRQFYYKYDKMVTEHLGEDHTIFMSIESLFKEEPSTIQIEAVESTVVYAMPKRIWRGWPCIALIYNSYIARYWRRVLSYRKSMRTWCVLRRQRIVMQGCVS